MKRYLCVAVPWCIACGRSCSSSVFDNGSSDGYEWKARDLHEKRKLAMEYMGDINKRRSIHDAIRRRVDMSTREIQSISATSLFERPEPDEPLCKREDESYADAVNRVIDEIAQDESLDDTLAHVDQESRSLLSDEFLDDSQEQRMEDTLKAWLHRRRTTADYHNYSSIPEKERNAWSAWYLRNIKAGSDHADNL